jgi:hypothetical protein
LYVPETFCCLCNFFYTQKQSFQWYRFWMTSAVKQHCKEWCFLYGYTLFMWSVFWDQKKWIMVTRKWLSDG